MHPILLQLGPVPVTAYAVFNLMALAAAYLVRKAETRRLGYQREPGHRWVGFSALVGAVVGAKLGMVMFVPPSEYGQLVRQMLSLDFTGKTVGGGIAGAFVAVELAKKRVGITHSTGDAFAVAVPLGQALGRLGCLFHGCCYGAPSHVPWAVEMAGELRHPTQAYESLLDLTLAGTLFALRRRPRIEGHLFRWFLIGYAAIRFSLEPIRGDAGIMVGPFTVVQLVCAAAIVGFGVSMWRRSRLVAPAQTA